MDTHAVTPDRSNTPTCQVVRAADAYQGQQGLNYFAGVSAETVGARGLCLHLVKLPPGTRAKAHLNADHETAAYVVYGDIELLNGDQIMHRTLVLAEGFLY